MDGLLRTLIRSRNGPSPARGGGRTRSRYDKNNGGGGQNRHFELILEVLARGLVEYAVRKYMPVHGSDREKRHDDRLRARNSHNGRERSRGGVPNMDSEMLEHLGRNILSKAMEKFGGGGGGDEDGREDVRHGRGRRKERGESVDRYAYSRERSRERPRRDHEERSSREREERTRGHSRDGRRSRHRPEERHGSPRPRHRDEQHRRRRHGNDYAPLKSDLEALSNAIISLNERQPGHADCEFYDAFMERSGKVQDSIGSVMVQIREREERREERHGRRR